MIILVTGIPGIGKGTQCKLLAQQQQQQQQQQLPQQEGSSPSYRFVHISSGDLLRREKQNTSTPLGQYIRDNWSYQKMSDIVFALIKQEVKKHLVGEDSTTTTTTTTTTSDTVVETVFLLDATPRTVDDCRKFDRMFHIDAVLSFEPSDNSMDFLVERLKGRLIHVESGRTYHETFNPPLKSMRDDITGEPLEKRDDDTDQAIRARLNKYKKDTQTIIDNYFGSCRHNLKRIYVNRDSTISDTNKQVLNVIQSAHLQRIRKEKTTNGPFKAKSIVENHNCSEVMFFEPFYDTCIRKMSALVRSSKHKNRFPGTNVIPMNKDHLAQMIIPNSDQYRIYPKLDGTRFFLLALKMNQKVVFIDRALNVFDASNMLDSQEIANITTKGDTLLDGEFLTIRKKQPLFVILDALYINGKQVQSLNGVQKRLEEAKQIGSLFYTSTEGKAAHDMEQYIKLLQSSSDNTQSSSIISDNGSHDRLHLCVQKGFSVREIRKLLQFVKLLQGEEVETDGIVFSKMNEPYRYGLTKESFKWKPLNKMTIDFELSYDQDTDRYNLLTWNDKTRQYEVYDVLADTTEDYSHLDGIVVECLYNPNAITTVSDSVEEEWTAKSTSFRVGQKRARSEDSSNNSNSQDVAEQNKKQKKRRGGWILVHERYDKVNPNPLWCVTNFMNEIHTLYIHDEQELCTLLLNE